MFPTAPGVALGHKKQRLRWQQAVNTCQWFPKPALIPEVSFCCHHHCHHRCGGQSMEITSAQRIAALPRKWGAARGTLLLAPLLP